MALKPWRPAAHTERKANSVVAETILSSVLTWLVSSTNYDFAVSQDTLPAKLSGPQTRRRDGFCLSQLFLLKKKKHSKNVDKKNRFPASLENEIRIGLPEPPLLGMLSPCPAPTVPCHPSTEAQPFQTFSTCLATAVSVCGLWTNSIPPLAWGTQFEDSTRERLLSSHLSLWQKAPVPRWRTDVLWAVTKVGGHSHC